MSIKTVIKFLIKNNLPNITKKDEYGNNHNITITKDTNGFHAVYELNNEPMNYFFIPNEV